MTQQAVVMAGGDIVMSICEALSLAGAEWNRRKLRHDIVLPFCQLQEYNMLDYSLRYSSR